MGLVAVPALVAVTAYAISGNWVPWLWAGGALVVLVLLGARSRWGPAGTAAAALAVADVVWLLAMPWWAWLLALTVAAAAALAWVVWTRRIAARHPVVIGVAAASGGCLVAGVVGLVLHVQAQAEQAAKEAASQRRESISRILPHSPSGVADYLVRTLARSEYKSACFAFTQQAAASFAAAHQAPDCEAAARTLSGQINDSTEYQNAFWVPGSQQSYDGDTVTVRVCDIDVGGTGPSSLGTLTVSPHSGGAGGFEITRWRPCA